MSSALGDDVTPVYEFEWTDGTVRKTTDAIESEKRHTTAIETLAELGRNDPECTVTLTGFK
jgi:hypothetical protein